MVKVVTVLVEIHTAVRQFDRAVRCARPADVLRRLARDGGGRGTKLQIAQSKRLKLWPSSQLSRQVVLFTEAMVASVAMALPTMFGDEVCYSCLSCPFVIELCQRLTFDVRWRLVDMGALPVPVQCCLIPHHRQQRRR